MTVVSPNDISRLRRPKNVKFGTKVGFSTRMMRTLDFWKKFFNCTRICKRRPEIGQKTPKMSAYSLCAISESKDSRNAEIGTNIDLDVRICPNFLCLNYALL